MKEVEDVAGEEPADQEQEQEQVMPAKPKKGRGKTTLVSKLFLAHKKLDISLRGDELLGAIRQCLHENDLYVSLSSTDFRSSEAPVVMTFHLRYKDECRAYFYNYLRGDFESMESLLTYGWAVFLCSLMGLPPSHYKPVANVQPKTNSRINVAPAGAMPAFVPSNVPRSSLP